MWKTQQDVSALFDCERRVQAPVWEVFKVILVNIGNRLLQQTRQFALWHLTLRLEKSCFSFFFFLKNEVEIIGKCTENVDEVFFFLPPHVAQTPSNATNQNSSEGIKVRSVQRCSLKCSAAAPPYTASEAVVSDLRIFSLSRWMMAPCVSAVPRPDVQGSATASTRGRRYDTPWINHPFITLHTGARTFLCSSLCGGRFFLLC